MKKFILLYAIVFFLAANCFAQTIDFTNPGTFTSYTINFDDMAANTSTTINKCGDNNFYTFAPELPVENLGSGTNLWEVVNGNGYSSNGGRGAKFDHTTGIQGDGQYINISNDGGGCEKTVELSIKSVVLRDKPVILQYYWNTNKRNSNNTGSIEVQYKLAADADYTSLDKIEFTKSEALSHTEWLKREIYIPVKNETINIKIIGYIGSGGERRSISLDDISLIETEEKTAITSFPFTITSETSVKYEGDDEINYNNIRYYQNNAADTLHNLENNKFNWRISQGADASGNANGKVWEIYSDSDESAPRDTAILVSDVIDIQDKNLNVEYFHKTIKISSHGAPTSNLRVKIKDVSTDDIKELQNITLAGATSEWEKASTISLEDFTGKQIQLMFYVIVNDDNVKPLKVQIDNIKVYEPIYNLAIVDIEAIDIVCPAVDQKADLKIKITNTGTETATEAIFNYTGVGSYTKSLSLSPAGTTTVTWADAVAQDMAVTDKDIAISLNENVANKIIDTKDSKTIQYTVYAAPEKPVMPSLKGTGPLCTGGEGEIELSVATTGATSYMWYRDPSASAAPTLSESTTTMVTATWKSTPGEAKVFVIAKNDNDCYSVNSDTLTLTINQMPTADFTATTDGAQVTIENKAQGATAWSWTYGDATGTSSDEDPAAYTYSAEGSYTITLTATNEGCEATAEQNVQIQITNVANIQNIEYAVYPNPATDMINIKADANIEYINVVDMLGKTVIRQSINNNQAVLNLSNQIKGVYFLQIQTDKGLITNKIMIK